MPEEHPSWIALVTALYLAEYSLYSNSSSSVLVSSSIAGDFHMTFLTASFVGVAFLIGFCSSIVPVSIVSGRWSPTYVFLWSSVVSVVLGVLAACSPSFVFLIVVRFLQGVASAVLSPQIFAIMRERFRAENQSRVLGMWGLAVSLSALCSPLVVSTLNDTWGWRSFPLDTTILGTISIGLLLWANRTESAEALSSKRPAFSDFGSHQQRRQVIALGALALFPVLIFASSVWVRHESGRMAVVCVTSVLVCLIVATLGALGSKEADGARNEFSPLLSQSLLVLFVASIGTNAYTLAVIYFLQQIKLMNSYQSALYLAPMALLAGLLPILRLGRPGSDRKNTGLVLLGCISFVLSGVTLALAEAAGAAILTSVVLMGCAMGFQWSSLAAIVVRNSSLVRLGSGAYNYLRALGGAIGFGAAPVLISPSVPHSRFFFVFGILLSLVGVSGGVLAAAARRGAVHLLSSKVGIDD
ncbi:hypothetical protein AWB85_15480 [Mycobacteroides immunogenum]|uniref:Major facilitator superfamily (MFS) profile domain-containing protein n=1 Tax=Mycobacteroides immunogenum TaxID=83262 RepID=A0A179V7M9_9MYCO|nr:MFS transporter [Mycobacteroides immunogenum]OAT67011.1 hypothetical protein AWB85_15480 [Mycobacteroides immunogenum]